MRISNLVSSAHRISQSIDWLVLTQLNQPTFTLPDSELTATLTQIEILVRQTKIACQKQGGKPEDLPSPSFRAYQWLQFLNQRKWLLAHIYAIDGFYRLLIAHFPELARNKLPRTIQIELYHSSYLFRSRQKDRKVYLEINEGFLCAPPDLKQDILEAALKRRTSQRLKRIKSYTSTTAYREVQSSLQTNTGENHLAGKGKVYDLVPVFKRVNLRYFNGTLDQPRLIWSARSTIRRLGTYHPESDTITINRRLDDQDIPEYLLEYVMYHEMLHKKIGLKEVNGRRYAHTKYFKTAERQFDHYNEAEEFIKKINRT